VQLTAEILSHPNDRLLKALEARDPIRFSVTSPLGTDRIRSK
jgi:hypothetical protein